MADISKRAATMPSGAPHGLGDARDRADILDPVRSRGHDDPPTQITAPSGMPFAGMNAGVKGQPPGLATGQMPRGDFGSATGQRDGPASPMFGAMPPGRMGASAMPGGAMPNGQMPPGTMTAAIAKPPVAPGAAMPGTAMPGASTAIVPAQAATGMPAATPGSATAPGSNSEGITLGGSWRLTFDLRTAAGISG